MTIEVIVTAGGTVSKIDDVRQIGNFSKGTTGCRTAEEFLARGDSVHYVYGRGARRPFRQGLELDPQQPFDTEVERLRQRREKFLQHSGRLREYPIETFEEYHDTVQRLLAKTSSDAIILSAAVNNYGGRKADGKISSDQDVLRVEFPLNPRVISLVKKWNPKIFQVGFKLLSRSTPANLIDVAYQHGIRNHSNLTVANSLVEGDTHRRMTFFITPEKGITPIALEEVAPRLAEEVHKRVSKNHYRTKLTKDIAYYTELSGDIEKFRGHARKLWRLNLFEPYYKGSDMHFGFIATRAERGGFLITARGSNKKDLPAEDIVYVPRVDFDGRTVYTNSAGKKASLNANVAGAIFQERPDVDLIMHAHVFPGLKNKTSADYSPATQEDVDEVMEHLRGGQKIVELVNHGIISVGRNVDDIVETLDVEPAYENFPELYDAIYNRFQQSGEFVDLVSREVGRGQAVLDLAAGTGEVAAKLLQMGYENISLADKSSGMLAAARKKIGADVPAFVSSMQKMALGRTYDAIAVRQAINYLIDYQRLVDGLKAVRDHLNPAGKIIFNAPSFDGSGYADKSSSYEHDGFDVEVSEMNALDGRVLSHTQRCTLLKKDGSAVRRVYDFNRFGLFTKSEFQQALAEAGFASARFFGKGLLDYSPDSRTLYCVAEK